MDTEGDTAPFPTTEQEIRTEVILNEHTQVDVTQLILQSQKYTLDQVGQKFTEQMATVSMELKNGSLISRKD